MHAVVFGCSANHGSIDLSLMAADLQLPVSNLHSYAKEVGCQIKKVKGDKGDGATIAELALPLQFPQKRMMKK